MPLGRVLGILFSLTELQEIEKKTISDFCLDSSLKFLVDDLAKFTNIKLIKALNFTKKKWFF